MIKLFIAFLIGLACGVIFHASIKPWAISIWQRFKPWAVATWQRLRNRRYKSTRQL